MGKRSTLEKHRDLKEHSDLAAEAKNIEMADITTVQEHGPRRRFPETVESPEKRGLAATAGPYDPNDSTLWKIHTQLV